jgi:hypothetical protein
VGSQVSAYVEAVRKPLRWQAIRPSCSAWAIASAM